MKYPYYYAWKNNSKRAEMYGCHFMVLGRGTMNSALVEFRNGQLEIISRNAMRRRPVSGQPVQLSMEYERTGK